MSWFQILTEERFSELPSKTDNTLPNWTKPGAKYIYTLPATDSTIKTIFHCLVEGFHSLANTHWRSCRWEVYLAVTYEQNNELQFKMRATDRQGSWFKQLTPYELEEFVLKCKNVLPKWNISSEVLKGSLFFFLHILVSDFQASQTRRFVHDKKKKVPLLKCFSAPSYGLTYICVVQNLAQKNARRSELVESGSLLLLNISLSSSFLPPLTTAFFISNFYLYTSVSFFHNFLFSYIILYIDISVVALSGCIKKKKL